MMLNRITLAVVVVGVAVYFRFAAALPWTPWRIAGLAIAAPAFALFVLARLQLGSAFSARAKAGVALVTTGIYARIRNPIYVFGGLSIAGVIIWAHRPWLLLVFAVLIPLQVWRVRNEERVLEAKFGDAYRAYKAQTWL
jgi:protein-S-isoprenylcysteine O-methyltransferase Ste14